MRLQQALDGAEGAAALRNLKQQDSWQLHIYIYDARHAALALLMSSAKRPQMSHRGRFEGEAAEAGGQWLCYIHISIYACRYIYVYIF